MSVFRKLFVLLLPVVALAMSGCEDPQPMAAPSVDLPDSLSPEKLYDAWEPERRFFGLDPTVTSGTVWESNGEGAAGSLGGIELMPSVYGLEPLPLVLLEPFDVTGDNMADALKSGDYDSIQRALRVLNQHAVPLTSEDRTASEIIAVFLEMDFEARETMNRAMGNGRWYISPSRPGGIHFLEGEPLRFHTPEETRRFEERWR